MVTIRFGAEKFEDDNLFILIPTVAGGFSKREMLFGIIWFRRVFGISIEWSRKAKIAANNSENK